MSLLKRKGKTVVVAFPVENMEAEKRKTITYRTMNLITKKTRMTLKDEVEKELEKIKEDIVFYKRGTRYVVVELKFDNKVLDFKNIGVSALPNVYEK